MENAWQRSRGKEYKNRRKNKEIKGCINKTGMEEGREKGNNEIKK